jgi:hypothetical protein
MHSIDTPPVSYLAAESGGYQGGHNDHGDNDLDGGENGSHVVYFVVARVVVACVVVACVVVACVVLLLCEALSQCNLSMLIIDQHLHIPILKY